MGGWGGRAATCAFGALFLVYAAMIFVIALKGERNLDTRDWLMLGWILFVRGLPGALFLAAGLAGDRNLLWAAAAILLAGLVIGPVGKRAFHPNRP